MTLKAVMSDCIHQRGLMKMAKALGVKPGTLGDMSRSDGFRKFDIGLLERYVEITGDRTPIYHLVTKHCGDTGAARDEAFERTQGLLGELPSLLASVSAGKRKGRVA